jgi:hypothetical protein
VRIRVFAGIGIAAALLGLTGCRSSPDVAAYVGDQLLTEDRVTQLIKNYVAWARNDAKAKQRDPAEVQTPDRTIVVNYVVRGAICDQLRNKLGFSVPEPNLPPEQSELVVIASRMQACEQALPAGEPVKPTEAEVRQIFDIGVANGIWPADSYGQTAPGLMADEDVADALGRKKAVQGALSGVEVTVNPKYGVVQLPLASFQGGVPAVSVSFGEAGPVNNRPVQASPPPQQ